MNKDKLNALRRTDRRLRLNPTDENYKAMIQAENEAYPLENDNSEYYRHQAYLRQQQATSWSALDASQLIHEPR